MYMNQFRNGFAVFFLALVIGHVPATVYAAVVIRDLSDLSEIRITYTDSNMRLNTDLWSDRTQQFQALGVILNEPKRGIMISLLKRTVSLR